MSIQWILPSIDPDYRRACLATMAPAIVNRTLVVDNCQRNRGVAGSWNLGRQRAINSGADWLVLVSESVRFGTSGGRDLEDALSGSPHAGESWIDTHLGWHLVAFSTPLLARVGEFDENFWPAYMEDTDYLIRLDRAGYASPRENGLPHTWLGGIDATHEGTEHSLKAGLVQVQFERLLGYWRDKWGANPPNAFYGTPFDLPDRDWTYWPEPARR